MKIFKSEIVIKNFINFILIIFSINLINSILISLHLYNSFLSLCCLVATYFIFFYYYYLDYKEKKNDKLFYLFIIFSILFWLFAFPAAINGYDDLAAYLVFAMKLVDIGTLPVEELSPRKIYNYGGLYPYQGYIAKINPSLLNFVEPVMGLFSFVIVINFLNINKLTKTLIITLLFLTPLMGSKIIANTAGVYTYCFYNFIIILLYFFHKKVDFSKIYKFSINSSQIVFLLMIFCFLISLSIRPFHAVFNIFILISFIMLNFNKIFEKVNLTKIILSLIMILIFIYPYILSSYKSSDTLLFPILGKGWHIVDEALSSFNFLFILELESVSQFVLLILSIFKNDYFFTIGLILVLLNLTNNKNKDKGKKIFLASSYVTYYMMIFFQAGPDLTYRYNFSLNLSFIILNLIILDWKFLKYEKKFKELLIAIPVISIIIMISAFIYAGKTVKENRIKYKEYELKQVLIKDISHLKELRLNNDLNKIAISSAYAYTFYNEGFKNLIINDTPLQMNPWFNKELKIEYKNLDKSMLNYYKNQKIKYILIGSDYDKFPFYKDFIDKNFRKIFTSNLNYFVFEMN